jgi:hypothetical protein
MTLYPAPGGSRPWAKKELRVLGTLPDEAIAAKNGKTKEGVR